MIRRKNALFAHFHGKLAKPKKNLGNVAFLFNLHFLNNKKLYQKQKKIKKIFQRQNSKKNN